MLYNLVVCSQLASRRCRLDEDVVGHYPICYDSVLSNRSGWKTISWQLFHLFGSLGRFCDLDDPTARYVRRFCNLWDVERHLGLHGSAARSLRRLHRFSSGDSNLLHLALLVESGKIG